MFPAKQTKFQLLYAQKWEKRLKPLKSQLNSKFLAYDYDFLFKPLQHINVYQIALGAKFQAKQTKFVLLYAQKCQKHLKNP